MENHQPTTTTVQPKAVTVGTFDGLHRGHREVIRTLLIEAERRGLRPAVITFDRHPLNVIAPQRAPKELMDTSEKIELLMEMGPDVELLHFTQEMMRMTAREWLRDLRDRKGVRLIVVGYDNTFGSDGRSMTPQDYEALGRELGVEVVVAPVVEGCSSSSARRAVADGDMEGAARILGRPYSLCGTVEHGDRIGRTIGFPTANLRLPDPDTRLLPPFGAYLSRAILADGRRLPAITNIGVRPSVSDRPQLRIETHILDFDEDIYHQPFCVELLAFMRPERKFSGLEALKEALHADEANARRLYPTIISPESKYHTTI